MIKENDTIKSQGEIALRMTNISKSFGSVKALSGVSFTVRKGTVHALVGENGAGKSTLMKVLSGVHLADEGTIEIGGEKKDFTTPADAIDAGISMIYQELDLAEQLTVTENVFLGMELTSVFGLDIKRMVDEAGNLMKRFNFEIDPSAVVEDLSTGDCQIIEIVKSLMRKARIIVMDEPTSSLSEAEATRLFEIVRDLRSRGYSIIYISHRLEEIVDLADDITVLRDGQAVHSETSAKLDIPMIVHHMVGRELDDFFPARDVKVGEVCFAAKGLCSDKGVRDVSFEIGEGEIVGMAGLVGAGRTEVARAIFGVDKKSGGSISLDRKELAIKTPSDAISEGIAFLTEDRKRTGLCLNLPCSWNVTLPNLVEIGMKHKIAPGEEDKIAARLGEQMSVKWASPQAPVNSLSGGNQQKVLIARWLLAESKFMIFDEPTRGIDVGAKAEIYNLLNDLAGKGKAILFISSELPELFGVADRILVMRRGRLVGNLKTSETTPDAVMHLAAVEENVKNNMNHE